MQKNKFYILHFTFYIIFIPILLNFSGCSSPTETPTGELSGIVNLEGMQDHSGIIIALYDLAYLDTTITRINAQYPQIGIKITQHTEFDHRFQSPIKFTETDIEGNFLIKKIPVGEYNIVAIKDSFGFKYIYEFEIEKGENQLTPQPPLFNPIEGEHKEIPLQKGEQKGVYSPMRTDADITLYAEQYLSGNITDNWIFETDHHYIIGEEGANSTNFTPPTNLEIQPGAIIRIEPANDLKIFGNLFAQGEENNMFWVTSNDGFSQDLIPNTLNPDEVAIYNSFELSSIASVSDDLISWGKFDFANTCLLNRVNNLHMQNGIFRNSQCGFYSTDVDSTFCENLLAYNSGGINDAGIFIDNVLDGFIKKNILFNCYNGLNLKTNCNQIVENNYIYKCENGIIISYYSDNIIEFNEISECIVGIFIKMVSTAFIRYNNISAEICIRTNRNNYADAINANYNNLRYLIYSFRADKWTQVDIDATNNFFFTTESIIIEESIYDKNDISLPPINTYCYVLYLPYLVDTYPYAGIQGE